MIYKRKKAVILFILICTLSISNYAEESFKDELGILNVKQGIDKLYIHKPDKIKKLSTMTYLIDSQVINDDLLTMFKSFANEIGRKHGATFITTNKNKLEAISKQGDLQHITEFTSNSSCNFFKLDNAYAIFEVLDQNECFYFPIKKPIDTIAALTGLKKAIKKYASLDKDERMTATYLDIEKISVEDEKILTELKRFASYIIEQQDA